LPPLNTVLARRFLEQTRIYAALLGTRGRKPVDLGALERLLVRFSELVIENTAIKEIDINPLLASPEGLLALDARVLLHNENLQEVPKAAIRSYPRKYSAEITLKDGTRLSIRPIRPEDEPSLVRFHGTLSAESVFRRYFTLLPIESRIRHERLSKLCFIDYDRQIALIAERRNEDNSTGDIIGVARLVKSVSGREAEVAAVVSDAFQRRGIGHKLVRLLIEFARDEGLAELKAFVLTENWAMQQLLEAEGFSFHRGGDLSSSEGEMYLPLEKPAPLEHGNPNS
jgi:acetyltransferase